MLPVRVEAKSGRIFELALDESMTVADLEEALDFHQSNFRLIQDNRVLEGTLPLKSLRKSRKAPYIDLKIVPRNPKNLPRPQTPCTTEGSSFVFDGFSWYVVNQAKTMEPRAFQLIFGWIQTITPNDVAEFLVKLFLGAWILKDQIGLQTAIFITLGLLLFTGFQAKLRYMLNQFYSLYGPQNGGTLNNGLARAALHFIVSMFPEFENE